MELVPIHTIWTTLCTIRAMYIRLEVHGQHHPISTPEASGIVRINWSHSILEMKLAIMEEAYIRQLMSISNIDGQGVAALPVAAGELR